MASYSHDNTLTLAYNAALCFIPTDELSHIQQLMLESVTYRWCNCELCTTTCAAHANIEKPAYLVICLSQPFWNKHLTVSTTAGFALLDLIFTIIHEIIHLLFINFTEEQVDKKVIEWLKLNVVLKNYDHIKKLHVAD
jgi:hypothetical protein